MKTIEPIPDALLKDLERISSNILHYHQCKDAPEDLNASSYTSFEYMDTICSDIAVASEKKCIKYIDLSTSDQFILKKSLSGLYPGCSITKGGFFIYPKGGYMGWHTNSNSPGKRVYISHVEDADKSFFRCIFNGKKITSYDKSGWNMREFDVGLNSEPLWHCVNAVNTSRISLGFRIIPNLKTLS